MVKEPIAPITGGKNQKEQEELEDSGTGFGAIDFGMTNDQLDLALEYINDTKEEMERRGPDPSVQATVDALKIAKTKMRQLEIDNVENMVPRQTEYEGMREVLVRSLDPKPFDDAKIAFEHATELFAAYFEKHIKLINS